jgi:hypothetical protein
MLTVNSTADMARDGDPYLSLREAVALVNSPNLPADLSPQIQSQISGSLHASGADTIAFDPAAVTGPIVLGGSQLELSLPRSTALVTIDGGGGLTVDANNASRVLMVDAGAEATLDHLTVTHGQGPGPAYGGGIANDGTLTLTNCTISANSALFGGGIANERGTLTVSNSTLSGNSAGSGGGGISSNDGGATLTVTGSSLVANTVGVPGNYGGGAIYNGFRATGTVSNSTLAANSARLGGGIFNEAATLTVSSSTLAANSATWGGGIYDVQDTLTVSNSTLSDNTAEFQGGGIDNDSGRVTVSSSTLYRNTVTNPGGLRGEGGGLFINNSSGTTLDLQNTIVAGNRGTATRGPDINGHLQNSSSYNLVGIADSTLSGITNGVNHNRIGVDPRLAPLGFYGGPTQTFALLPGSPALNAGDPSLNGTDQRGQARVAGSSDIGAFQTQTAPFLVTTLQDPGRQFGQLALREAVALANALPGDHTVSFDPNRDGGVVILTAGQLELSGTGRTTTLDGAGRFTLDGDNATRLLQIDAGTTVELRGLALVNGNAGVGAGVYNRGTLTVAGCVLYGNVAYAGGAVLNEGALTASGCTFGFNVATFGGAVLNSGVLVAFNSTFAYNAALASGGAIENDPTGTATLTSLTISLNSADDGGGLDVAGGLVVIRNCIVAGNYNADAVAASDISGTVDSGSTYNLIGTGGGGGLTDGMNHNQVGVADPGLTTPDFTSQQTPVFGLTSDSPARGAGDPSLLGDPVLGLDQHGNPRSGPPNIGAV